MIAIVQDMIHKEMEIYGDDMIAKSIAKEDYLANLEKFLKD